MPEGTMEILLIDGKSTDKTLEIIKDYSKQYSFINVITNEKIITPAAFNLGIKHAQADYVIIIGAHSTYNKEYVSRCLGHMKRDKVDHAGGMGAIIPKTPGFLGNALCFVFTHPFGVGNSLMRTGVTQPTEADTASTGCYHKSTFEKIGYFNENLKRTQDIELNRRLKKSGGRIFVYPDLICTYYSRSSLQEIIPHAIKHGQWILLPFIWVECPVYLRHFIPFFFVLFLLVGPLICLIEPLLWIPFLGILLVYFGIAAASAIQICRREKQWKYLSVLPCLFFIYHFCYGLGSIIGGIKVLTSATFYKRKLKQYA